MRVESSVTSLSWIPVDAVSGHLRLPMDVRVAHYDPPPPDKLGDLSELRRNDGFRFANELRAYIEVSDDGPIVDYGQTGRGLIGATTLRLGSASVTLPAVALPDLRPEPEMGDGWVRFVQTAGGRTGAPAPRRVARPPYVQVSAPIAWTTLALTIHADGRSEFEVVGASPFPRHWFFDHDGTLVAKSGLIDFRTWSKEHFGDHSPWGDRDAPAVVMAVESTLERALSTVIMSGRKPTRRKLSPGTTLVEQGAPGDELYLLLDGVLAVEVDGEVITEVGPGSILGEGAALSGGRRNATLRAVTPCRVAVARADDLDRDALAAIRDRRQAQRGEAH